MSLYSFFSGVEQRNCLICGQPLENPTRTQKVHQIGSCKNKFDAMRLERDKERARLRYARKVAR